MNATYLDFKLIIKSLWGEPPYFWIITSALSVEVQKEKGFADLSQIKFTNGKLFIMINISLFSFNFSLVASSSDTFLIDYSAFTLHLCKLNFNLSNGPYHYWFSNSDKGFFINWFKISINWNSDSSISYAYCSSLAIRFMFSIKAHWSNT